MFLHQFFFSLLQSTKGTNRLHLILVLSKTVTVSNAVAALALISAMFV